MFCNHQSWNSWYTVQDAFRLLLQEKLNIYMLRVYVHIHVVHLRGDCSWLNYAHLNLDFRQLLLLLKLKSVIFMKCQHAKHPAPAPLWSDHCTDDNCFGLYSMKYIHVGLGLQLGIRLDIRLRLRLGTEFSLWNQFRTIIGGAYVIPPLPPYTPLPHTGINEFRRILPQPAWFDVRNLILGTLFNSSPPWILEPEVSMVTRWRLLEVDCF